MTRFARVFIQSGQRLRLATTGIDAQQSPATAVRENDGVIGRPEDPRAGRCFTNRNGNAALDWDSLNSAIRNEPDPVAVGREERIARVSAVDEDDRSERVQRVNVDASPTGVDDLCAVGGEGHLFVGAAIELVAFRSLDFEPNRRVLRLVAVPCEPDRQHCQQRDHSPRHEARARRRDRFRFTSLLFELQSGITDVAEPPACVFSKATLEKAP